MCTILLLHKTHPDFPVVVAANRDELYARGARPPEVLRRDPRAIGGVDLACGGTWMGTTEDGLFAGLSNQPSERGRDAGLRSRGEVVLGALAAGSRAAARALVGALDAREFNPFNLVFGDAGGLEVAYARPERREIELGPVPPGVHVLPNGRLDTPAIPKVARVLADAEPLARLPREELFFALARLLASHEKPPLSQVPEPTGGPRLTRELLRDLQATCVHTPSYGTRSSTLIALEPGKVACYLYSDGPPCRTELEDVTWMLRR